MKIFISWSGNLSKNLAEILRQWLPAVVQAVRPYYSPDDITKGARWTTEISKELEESSVGIICLTSDNLEAPWIMFEAGALSKKMDKSKVCPILFGLEPSDIQGPLVQFQAAKFDKEEIKKVVKMINVELADRGLATNVFDDVFEMWWPKLKERVENELKTPKKHEKGKGRSERELLEEVLELTRSTALASERDLRSDSIHPAVVRDLIEGFRNLAKGMRQGPPNNYLLRAIEEFRDPMKYLVRHSDLPRGTMQEFDMLLEELLMGQRSKRSRLIFDEGAIRENEPPEGLKNEELKS